MKLIIHLAHVLKAQVGTWDVVGTMPAEALKGIAGTLIIGLTGALVFYVRKLVNSYERNEQEKRKVLDSLLSNSAEKDKRDKEYMLQLDKELYKSQELNHLDWINWNLKPDWLKKGKGALASDKSPENNPYSKGGGAIAGKSQDERAVSGA